MVRLTRAVTVLPIHSNTSELSWVIYSLWRYSKSSQVLRGWGWFTFFFSRCILCNLFCVSWNSIRVWSDMRWRWVPPFCCHSSGPYPRLNSHKQENLNTKILFFFFVLFVYCCICFIVSIDTDNKLLLLN